MNNEAVKLLKSIIAIGSISRDEKNRADFLQEYLEFRVPTVVRVGNNLVSLPTNYDSTKPNLILNSHIDTVKPNESYTKNPYLPHCEHGRIYGLGSNDAGASVVSMIQSFIHLHDKDLEFNLILLLSAEEEIGGENGILMAINKLPEYFKSTSDKVRNYAIIGEPTQMKVAIAERGLIVVDGLSHGQSAHVAHDIGDNAIYMAMRDIRKIRNIKFDRTPSLMGGVKINICQIEGGKQHNIVPDRCKFVIDIRPNDKYTNEEIVDILDQYTESELTARSFKNKTSISPANNPLLKTAQVLALDEFISDTGSDWMKVDFVSIKMGVGDSLRSHCADEYVYEAEIEEGINKYIEFIKAFTI